MAHRIQGLIALVAAAAAMARGQTRPFSHKLHIGLGLECVKCHATAPASEKASDNNLPAQAVCRACHDRDMPVKQSAAGTVTHFNHSLHVKFGDVAPVIRAAIDGKTYHLQRGAAPAAEVRKHLAGGVACAACHRGLEQSEQVSKAAFPQMADCLVCHPKIDAPFSCEKCHDAGEHLKPPDHRAQGYIDVHSTAKANLDKPSCVICHGRKFQCLGCH